MKDLSKEAREEEKKIREIKKIEAKQAKDNITDKDFDYFIVTWKKSQLVDAGGKESFDVQMFNHSLPGELINALVGLVQQKPILEPMLMQVLALVKSKKKANITLLKNNSPLKIVKK